MICYLNTLEMLRQQFGRIIVPQCVKLGGELSEVGKVLGVSRKGVSRCMRRGEKALTMIIMSWHKITSALSGLVWVDF